MSHSTPAVIVGIDEAGRGALAGPVVAAACVEIPELSAQACIRDSKQLQPQKRENAYAWIAEHCLWGIGSVDAAIIDEKGILSATEQAMQTAVADLEKSVTPTYLLIDGRDKFWFNYPHSSIVRGDTSERCIAAASILAKVTRDRLMVEYGRRLPYGFEIHKGYGTKSHFAAIQKHGLSILHRRTFLKNRTTHSAPTRNGLEWNPYQNDALPSRESPPLQTPELSVPVPASVP
ncbi:ribonuclease HII [Candidatus Peregrinibacteria bacterium CG10_big_fil_rev_8_21_14_0_10_49_10]|nr:MAG: ribonuclease HII [Candidatus Peregrinibacteria bacterium CG10_big_fil_rev_8_21_14_0_10_49_10]